MDGINSAFYFVIDRIIDLQAFFIRTARGIGAVVLLIAILSAALNYALTGTGLKENIIKIMKATVFCVVILFAYPQIVGAISSWTLGMARESVYPAVRDHYERTTSEIADIAATSDRTERRRIFARRALASPEAEDSSAFFGGLFGTVRHPNMEVTTVAPAAVLRVSLLVAGGFFDFAQKGGLTNLFAVILGLIMTFAIILTAIFAVMEYGIAFLEFMLVATVGVILLPLSIWEGSKFMAEKYVGAMIGFFIKLLFSSVAIFFMLYLFTAMALHYTRHPFTGTVDEILFPLFACLLAFFICKSAPALAQSLLTGTPSLSATGAISAAAGAIGAAGATLGMAGKVGKAAAAGTAKAAFAGAGAVSRAASAATAVGTLGGDRGDMAKAFMGSMGHGAVESVRAKGGDMVRSLLGDGQRGGVGSGGIGGAGAGINRHSETQKFLGETNPDGTKKSFSEHIAARMNAGTEAGIDYMARKEARENGGKGET